MKRPPHPITPYILPRLQDILFISVFFFVCTQGFRLLNGDGDLGRHIVLGNYILDHWTIPIHNIFSSTMSGEYFVPHEWLSEVIFSIATRILGLNGAVLLSGIIIALTFVIVYKQTIGRGVFQLVALFTTAWAVLASFLHWLIRPHIFTFLFIAIWILYLEKAITSKKPKIWILPAIMLIWANTHGGFFLGFVILVAYFTGWAWEYWLGHSNRETGAYLATTGVLSFVVSFINPTGWHLWATSTSLIGKRFIIDNTSEYLSPNFHVISTWPFLIMLTLSIILTTFQGYKLRKHEIFLLSGWTVLSLYMARNIPLYAIVTAPYFGTLIQPTLDGFNPMRHINNILTNTEKQLKGFLYPVFTIILVTFSYIYGVRFDSTGKGNQHDTLRFPVEASNWLKENPQSGNMFNDFIWGGYLLYRLWPEQTIFIDGTTDFYGEALTREYAQVVSLQNGWQTVLTKYDISWAIIPSDSPLAEKLKDELGWKIIYIDRTASIIRKP